MQKIREAALNTHDSSHVLVLLWQRQTCKKAAEPDCVLMAGGHYLKKKKSLFASMYHSVV